MKFFAYVLHSGTTGRYYTGCTKDVDRRLAQHNSGMTEATRPGKPWRLVYVEDFETLAQARKRETQIKSWKSRSYMEKILGLVE